MNVHRAIVWFRQDLRLHDNEALTEALKNADELVFVYVFDERIFRGQTSFGFPKTAVHRARFIIQAVQDLRQRLRAKQCELIVRVGKPEEIIFDLARKTKSSWVFCNRERTRDELQVQDALEQKLWTIGREMRYSRGKMLYYTADLPFPITHTPDTFSSFKKEVERFVPIRQPLATPDTLPVCSAHLSAGDIPSVADFGHDPVDEAVNTTIVGGETQAIERLHYYLWETDLIQQHRFTKDRLLGDDFSSKFSAYLAQGCLSPKLVSAELKRYEIERSKDKSTHALFIDLLWRDFFRLLAKKYEERIFLPNGITERTVEELADNKVLFDLWANAKTEVPFIDANMRELHLTGYMSNRGRQNVASFLVNKLKVNWQMGAEYFESMLIDYDVSSNWGNWNLIAGVGHDLKESHEFNVDNQAKRFDPHGEYVRYWLPELVSE